MAGAIGYNQAKLAIKEALITLREYKVGEEFLPKLEKVSRLEVSIVRGETDLWMVSLKEDCRLWVFFRVDDKGEYLSVMRISLRDDAHGESKKLDLELVFDEERRLERFSIWMNSSVVELGIMGVLFLKTLQRTGKLPIIYWKFWVDAKFLSGGLVIATGHSYEAFLRSLAS